MARGRIATPEEEEEERDHKEESSRKKRRTANGKKASTSADADGNGSDSEGPLGEDEQETAAALRGWTVGTFTDKPVQATKVVLQQLRRSQDLLQSQIGAMETSVGKIQDVACALEDCRWGLPAKFSSKSKASSSKMKTKSARGETDGNDDEQEDPESETGVDEATEKRNEATAKSLEDKVKQLIDEIKIIDCRMKAVGEIISVLQQEEQVENMAAEMRRRFEKILGNYVKASDWTKYKNDKLYKDFKQAVWDIRHVDEACPPVSTFLEKGPDDPESDDDDIEMGGTTQDYKCPMTLMPYENAVSSTKCPHSFSAAAIREHITQSSRRSAKCPVAGCDKMLSLSDIKPNAMLQKKSDQVKARQLRRREEEEAADAEDAELIE
ncbi:hypothetical protein NliqN6_3608 [Naganishia liquefaciens]|uniref:SP-RING-type domain-containing protein n=1 Tax=Naganishia liquefaciens TaxID=104408 RepID=A0A8H3YH12_9TREE|nr:hypothetical protein NliqN6_3608 [Naganishia liquefaciens]